MQDTAQITDQIRSWLKLKSLQAKDAFGQNHPHAKTFFDSVGLDLDKIRSHSAKLLTAGALGGTLLLSAPHTFAQAPLPDPLIQSLSPLNKTVFEDPQDWLKEQLNIVLPPINNPWSLPKFDARQEKIIGKIIERATGVPAVPALEGEHLNTIYGYTGYEQHLMRYPADSLAKHDEFQSAGIAPGLGGFGYFTEEGKLTPEGIVREKYYIVAQLMYLPDWETRTRYLANWYKWRKMVMVNVDTGKVAVGVMGDAGPAAWTGKHFGASPEIMNILGGPRLRKGRVLMYFVDDPENKIPLGEVRMKPIVPRLEQLSQELKIKQSVAFK